MTRRTTATLSRDEATVPAQRRTDATPPKKRRKLDLTHARLRTDYYKQRAEEVHGVTTIDGRAKLFGLHRSTIVRLEMHDIEPRLGLAMHIARTLKVPVDAIWIRPGQVS